VDHSRRADEESKRKLFLRGKNNTAADTGGLAYTIESKVVGDGIATPYIKWHGPVTITADEAMARAGTQPSAADVAEAFLEGMLASGPMTAKALQEEAERRGISWRTVQRPKAELRIASRMKDKAGPEAVWVWSLPED
jgi:putative DNA primase/helicase